MSRLAPAAALVGPAAVLVGIASGGLIAGQSRINAALGADLDQPVLAAVISNGGGLVVLTVLAVVRPATRAGLRGLRTLPWWRCSGGAFGAVLVAGAAVVVPSLGVALFTIGNVAGQTVAGLAVDRTGFGPGGRRPVSALRVAGAALTVGAVVLAESGATGSVSLPLLVAAAGIGVASAIQQALNGRLQAATADALVPTTVNFVVGTAALLVGWAAYVGIHSASVRRWPGQWWLYCGGLLGIGLVLSAVLVAPAIGVFRLGLSVIAGQLAGAVVLDALVPTHSGGIGATVIGGVLLTFVAVVVVSRARADPGGGD